MRAIIVSLLLAGVAVTVVTAEADAQGRRRVYQVAASDTSIPLTVNRRSWLDPGNSAPHGATGPRYMSASTPILSRTPDHYYTDSLGNSIFPGQPYVPGRTVPVVSFSTLPNGDIVTDNVLHYQPN